MQLISRTTVLSLILVLSAVVSATSARERDPQGSAASASQQEKLKACNDLADKKGLKGDDRKNFLQDCANKAADAKPVGEMSNKEKLDACKDLADKKNLKGEDRKSFLKDCVNKAKSK